MFIFNRKRSLSRLAMRWSDGGDPAPAPTPAPAPVAPSAVTPVEPPPTQPGSGKTYTEAELETAKADALAAYKQHLEEARDYEKMTAEEKVAYLEAKAVEDKLTAYTTQKLAAESIPVELALFARGKNEAETDERIGALKAAIAKGVQDGVDARFKGNSFIPRGSAAGTTPPAETKTRQRGVSIQ